MLRDFDKKILGLPRTQEEKNAMVAEIGGRVRDHARKRGSYAWNHPIGQAVANILIADAALLRKIAGYPVPGKRR